MKATFYGQFVRHTHGKTAKAKLIKSTLTKPDVIEGVVVKITLDIPDAAFQPLEAEGVIEAGFVGIPIVVEPEEEDWEE